MPAIPSYLMESSLWQEEYLTWANINALLAPRVNVKGRMALVVLVAVVWAFTWLLWRAYSVIQTPNDLLVEKLGLDIPPPPSVTLEEIGAKEIQISWKAIDLNASVHGHQIELNGKVVGETKKHENAAQIFNLRPQTRYDVRVFSISSGRFQTPSAPLHVRTILGSEGVCNNDRNDETPAVRALAPRLPPTPSPNPAPSMAREQSGGPVGRRGTLGRRASPAGQEAAPSDGSNRHANEEADGNLPELSQQLQNIEQEIRTTDSQLVDDDKDFEISLREKEAERDDLKRQLREREDASSDLRKQVHKAEATNRQALSEKSKKERLLEQKKNQRQKRKDEMRRWDEQMGIIVDDLQNIESSRAIVERKKQSDINEVRLKIQEEEALLKILEGENKEKHQEIKALEEERKQLEVEEETDETREVDRLEQEKHRRFTETMDTLTKQYQSLYYELQVAQHHVHTIHERLENSRRAAAYAHQPMVQPEVDNYRRGLYALRQNRHASSHGSNVSSPRTVFGVSTEPYNMNAHFSTTVNAPPTVAGPSFFNSANGMTLMMPQDAREDIFEEPEFMTGAPMSPRADALLPADLLGDESNDEFDGGEDAPPQRSQSAGMRSDAARDENGSKSPETSSSPRSFVSPGEAGSSKVEWDRQSSHSPPNRLPEEELDTRNKRPSHAKKPSAMASLFHFNRQRGKTLADQPPLLGSLKPGQSQSFPRNFDEFDPSAQPRRRMSYGNNRHFPATGPVGRPQDPERVSSTRRAFPNLFSKSSAATQSYDPFDPDSMRKDASPSRPSSVYSFDKMPRVSAEGQFHAWSGLDRGVRNYSPLADWSLSRSHSRRPSIGYGSTSNLSLGPAPDEEYVAPRREPSRPLQAPIGTRPASSQRDPTPKLNPAAPSFNMFFGKSREKAKEKAKAKEEERRKAGELENISPPESRRSKDTHSIAATASTHESRDSLERIPSSYSGNTTPLGEVASKPTFMSKITRKASANKFGPWKGQGSIFSRKDPGTPTGNSTGADTEDEIQNGSFEHLGKSYESMNSTPNEDRDKKASRSSLGSWNFMRKSKKGDKDKKEDPAASEVSESITSEHASRASIDAMAEELDGDDAAEIPLH